MLWESYSRLSLSTSLLSPSSAFPRQLPTRTTAPPLTPYPVYCCLWDLDNVSSHYRELTISLFHEASECIMTCACLYVLKETEERSRGNLLRFFIRNFRINVKFKQENGQKETDEFSLLYVLISPVG